MYNLMDAASLVPFREEPAEEKEPTALMILESFIESVVVPKTEERATMEWSFSGLVSHFHSKNSDKEKRQQQLQEAEAIIRASQAEDDERARRKNTKKHGLIDTVVRWAVKRLFKWVVKKAIKAVAEVVFNVGKRILMWGVEAFVDWVVRPILTMGIEALALNPEIWIPLVAIVGAGGVLWWAYKKFFAKDATEPTEHEATKAELNKTRETANSGATDSSLTRGQSLVSSTETSSPPVAANSVRESSAPVNSITQTGKWKLGATSSRFESGRQGAATISGGVGDLGGVSYGAYQFSSKTGGVQEYLKNSVYGKAFEGLTPGTDAFNAKWKELAKDPAFGQDQHDFIKGKYYDTQMRRLTANGFDFSDRGPAVQDMVFSTAVQIRGHTLSVVQGALAGQDWKKWTDAQIVAAVQDYKYDHTKDLFRSSPQIWDSLMNRAKAEKQSLVALAIAQPGGIQGNTSSLPDAQAALSRGTTTAPINNKQASNSQSGSSGGGMMGPTKARTDASNVVRGPQGTLIALNS